MFFVFVATKSRSVANNILFADTWVGAKARKWLDGRNVDRAEWGVNQPNEEIHTCVVMVFKNGKYLLFDTECNNLRSALLCMRG